MAWLAVLQPLRQDAQGQRFLSGDRFVASLAVGEHVPALRLDEDRAL